MKKVPSQTGGTGPGQTAQCAPRRASRKLRRSSALLGAMSLTGAAAFVPSTAAVAAAPNGRGSTATTAASSCDLPVVSDSYDGFKVGVPTRWGRVVPPGPRWRDRERRRYGRGALVPALLTRGVTTQSLFSSFMTYEQHLLRKQGEALTYTERPGAEPAGSFEVRGSGAVLAGHATVLVLPQRTAVTTQVGVAFAYWAPQAQLSAAGPTLAQIGRCYQPERADLFQLFRNVGPFTFTMPSGWRVSSLSQDYVQLNGFNGGAGVDYELWGPFEQGVNATQPITSAGSAIEYMFNLYHIKITKVLAAYPLPEQAQTAGGFQATEYMEFVGTLNGKATHGFVNMVVSIDGATASGVIRLGLANPGLWNSIMGDYFK